MKIQGSTCFSFVLVLFFSIFLTACGGSDSVILGPNENTVITDSGDGGDNLIDPEPVVPVDPDPIDPVPEPKMIGLSLTLDSPYTTYTTTDGTGYAWGASTLGGGGEVSGLTDVVKVVTSSGAFAALKKDGSVITWGSANFGGDSADAQTYLTNVYDILPMNSKGFIGLSIQPN